MLVSRPAAFLRTGNVAAIAAAAGIAYYLGSWIGLQLRLPPATPSVLWPPNAIVTTLLLFVPVNRWWTALLGAAIAHFTIQLPVWPPATVTGLFLTNCSEAMMAAGGVRYFSDHPTRFDTLRRVAIFVVMAALLAPFFSSFLDAAVVSFVNREDYWAVWKLRFMSNVLAELAIVPALAGLLNSQPTLRDWPWRKALEALAIGGGLVLVAFAVVSDAGRMGLGNTPLSPVLPLLLWAAVRFGATGVGVTVLATVLLATTSTVYGEALLPALTSDERIRTLQMFLIAATPTLLCVGALVEDRREVLKALHASDLLKSSILSSIPSMVAVIGRNGRIVAVNESWRLAGDKGVRSDFSAFSAEPGASYLEVWANAAHHGVSNARAGYEGIQNVLNGSSSSFALEYSSDGQRNSSWWLMSVVPLKSAKGGAVITHTDITARKRAEHDAEESRDELTHASRVWVMGELTAALSHQLKQPLTGIIGNAHAGQRLLHAHPPDLVEVQQILADIISDAQRAADVTSTIRDMLRKHGSEEELVDINELVRDTTMLATGQAAIHDVVVHLKLARGLPSIRGRRVQLRQVVLNLTINAIEAVAERGPAQPRTVTVRTELESESAVRVSVVDTGCGLAPGSEDHVFEPLFTTKQSGMGMGLPIARTIVEAHGGALWVGNSSPTRTVFHFTLPVSEAVEHTASPAAVLG